VQKVVLRSSISFFFAHGEKWAKRLIEAPSIAMK
jgi:hypothetical protein